MAKRSPPTDNNIICPSCVIIVPVAPGRGSGIPNSSFPNNKNATPINSPM